MQSRLQAQALSRKFVTQALVLGKLAKMRRRDHAPMLACPYAPLRTTHVDRTDTHCDATSTAM